MAVGAAILLALAGAFDTGANPLHERLAYWLIVMGAGSIWGQLCHRLLMRWPRLDDRPWLHILMLVVAVAPVMSLVVWATTGLFFHGGIQGAAFWPLAVPVLVVTAAVCTLIVLLGQAPVQTYSSAGHPSPPRFLHRLPPHLREGRLIAIQAEDHYLRVHTTNGSDLILMRLSDALDELNGVEGAQTHRSWWVARGAVRGARRHEGRATLRLDGGLTAPVSRRFARALRESGWF